VVSGKFLKHFYCSILDKTMSCNGKPAQDHSHLLLKVALNTIILNQTYLFFVDLALKGDKDIITVSRFPFSLSAQHSNTGGGKQRKPPTCSQSLTNFIT
jgi:hypothetical protein